MKELETIVETAKEVERIEELEQQLESASNEIAQLQRQLTELTKWKTKLENESMRTRVLVLEREILKNVMCKTDVRRPTNVAKANN